MIDRLAEDHANARRLAEALAEMDGIVSRRRHGPADARARSIPAASRPTSSCSRSIATAAAFLDALRARNVLMVEYPHGQVRAVTHYGVDRRRHRARRIEATRRRPGRDRAGATAPVAATA